MVLAVTALAILAVVGVAAATAPSSPGTVLPGVKLDGRKVGGLNEEELRSIVQRMAERRARQRVRVVAPATLRDRPSVTATFRDLGYQLDLEATVESVLHRGLGLKPGALADRLLAPLGMVNLHPAAETNDQTFDAWIGKTAKELSAAPQQGTFAFEDGAFRPVYPEPGRVVKEGPLGARVRNALASGGSRTFTADAKILEPPTTRQDVDHVIEVARMTVSAPVRLVWLNQPIDLVPDRLGAVLTTRLTPGAEGRRLELAVDAGKLKEVLARDFGLADAESADAHFQVSGTTVQVVPSQTGFRLKTDEAAATVMQLMLSPATRQGPLPAETTEPRFTTSQAEALNIRQLVSSFTTHHRCCEPRVGNIHRVVEIVDGAIIKPGEVVSLNQLVGPRTPERGFVPAPAIRHGKFVDEVGGGVSQFATTFYNAIFLGGYDVIDHQAHSYYFKRYPMGRDATVGWPEPDVKFRNDSPSGILVDASYTDTSVTVSFYGLTALHVSTDTGRPSNFTPAPEKEDCKPDGSLPPGQVRVVAQGGRGFDVLVRRTLTYPDGRRVAREVLTRYLPEARVVEAASCPG